MQQGYPAPGGYLNANSSSPASTAATGTAIINKSNQLNGGRFDFDDGGTYCGGWEDGKAHGHGMCTGPKGQGAYYGSWHYGFEVSGVYTWPSGSSYEGQWQNGKRHGLGVETRDRWIYRGEWTQGFKGRYGSRQSTTSSAKYEGTWANGLQDGYGSETYADGGIYQGQWLRGMRHGYGVRTSAPFGLASHYRPKRPRRAASRTSLRSNEDAGQTVPFGAEAATAAAERDRRIDDSRGGFVLKARSDEPPQRRRSLAEKSLKKSILSGLKMRKQRSTGDLEKRVTSIGSIRSTASTTSWMSTESSHSGPNGGSFHTDSNASFVVEDEHMDANVTETYMGEWKNDKRSGFGISERTDGLRYEGEWFNNKKYGYGVTINRDGAREAGKYKNNVLITSQKKKHIFLIRSAKFRERIEAAVNAAQRASKIALQKADIAISRMATARGKSENADACAYQAREDFEIAAMTAKQFAPDFTQPKKIQLRDLFKHRVTSEEKVEDRQIYSTLSDSVQNLHSPGGGQTVSLNPPLPLRGQTPQHFRQRQSSQFQPKSLYAPRNHVQSSPHTDPSRQSFQQQQQQQQNYRSSTPTHDQQMQPKTNYIQNQTDTIHYEMQAAFRGQEQKQQPQQYFNQKNRSGTVEMSSSGNPFYSAPAHLNSRPSRASVVQIPPHLQQQQQQQYSKPNALLPKKYVPSSNMFPSNSGQSPYLNSASGSCGENVNGYRASIDYSQQNAAFDSGVYPMDQSTDLNEPYQRNAGTMLQKNTKILSDESPYSFKQAVSDHFDHYARPPSRDSSVDRYTRAASRLSGNSRQPSVDRTKPPAEPILSESSRASSVLRSSIPQSNPGNGPVTGPGTSMAPSRASASTTTTSGLPFEDFILRKRSLGQEIVPSPIGQPKRTESLHIAVPSFKNESHNKNASLATQVQRKKSMPDFQSLPNATTSAMTREEVSVLSSARREELRRQQVENERLRANPLLYLVSPQVKKKSN